MSKLFEKFTTRRREFISSQLIAAFAVQSSEWFVDGLVDEAQKELRG